MQITYPKAKKQQFVIFVVVYNKRWMGPLKGYCTMCIMVQRSQLLFWSQQANWIQQNHQKMVLALELAILFESSKAIKKNLTSQKANCSLC